MWEIILKDLPFYLLNLGAFVMVIFVTWLWARTRFIAEIAKYQTELVKVQLQRNDQLFLLEDDCKKKYERLRLILKDLRTQIHLKKVEMVASRRNELSNVLILDYCPAMQKYTRLADEMFCFDRQKRRQFIENHLNPFLQLSGDLLELMNMPKVMELLEESAMTVKYSYMDFDFAFDFARKKKSVVDIGLIIAMNRHLKRMGFARDVKVLN